MYLNLNLPPGIKLLRKQGDRSVNKLYKRILSKFNSQVKLEAFTKLKPEYFTRVHISNALSSFAPVVASS